MKTYKKLGLLAAFISILLICNGMDIKAAENVTFKEPEQKFYYFEKKLSENELNNYLPQTIGIIINGEEKSINVKWKCFTNDYESTSYYAYQFVPVINEEVGIQADDREFPYVFVCFGDECVQDGSSQLSRASSYKNNKNMKKVINYLTGTMGLSSPAACGIAANIYCESNCEPDVIEYGYTWDNGGGYGLCQWTNYPRTSSTGRRTELIKFSQRRGVDYKNINTQLKYLFYELTTLYSGVLCDIKNIEESKDIQQQAYDAAYLWCYEFEAPLDKENASIARGNFAKSVWNEYGDNSVKTRAPKLGAPSYPSLINEGKGYSVKGNVVASKKITKVKIAITDSNGKSVISKSAVPDSKEFNLVLLDNYITFNKLKTGQYYYKIYVTTEDGTFCLMNKDFVVCSSKPSIWAYSKPGTYDCGNAFMICGDVVSSDSIVSVKAGIYKKNNGKEPVYYDVQNCSTNQFDLNILNKSLLFHKLPGRVYYYRIDVTTTSGTYNVLNSSFKVEPSGIPKIKTVKQSYKSKTYLSLKWSKVNMADGYRVYRSDSLNGKYVKIATLKGNSNTTYKNTGLNRNKSYYYKIYPYVVRNGITTLGPASDKLEARTK